MPAEPEDNLAALAAVTNELDISMADLSPVLVRVACQWLEVLPSATVGAALQKAVAADEPLHAFRTEAQSALALGRTAARGGATATVPPGQISQSDLSALAAQDRLVAMSDSEYLEELNRRRQQLRRLNTP